MTDEIKMLFESVLLNDESKVVLKEAFDAAVKAKEDEIEAKYKTMLEEAKENALASVVDMIEEAVAEELEVIGESVVEARTLEIRYADKLEDFKASYAEAQEERTKILIAEAVAEEMAELQEEIEMAKKNDFAMQLVESFGDTYARLFGSVENADAVVQLEEARQEIAELKREKKLNELLDGVTGRKRDVAMVILESVEYDKLEDRFESIRGYLLSESKEEGGKVIEESAKEEISGTVVIEEGEDPEKEARPVNKKVNDAIAARLERSLKLAKSR